MTEVTESVVPTVETVAEPLPGAPETTDVIDFLEAVKGAVVKAAADKELTLGDALYFTPTVVPGVKALRGADKIPAELKANPEVAGKALEQAVEVIVELVQAVLSQKTVAKRV